MLTADLPGTGGTIKGQLEDFVVDEIPAYSPSGEGEHLFVRVEKRGLTTEAVAGILARAGGVNRRDVGWAGRKDKWAVTTQWFSLPAAAEALEQIDQEGLRVLEATPHTNKLRTGHLKGNHFRVVVRGVVDDAEARANAVLERIRAQGLPNLYGPQRFGRDGQNPSIVIGWLTGQGKPPRDKRKRKLLISSLQSLLFNQVVVERLERDLFIRPLLGDVIKIHGSGGMFVAEDLEEVEGRMAEGKVSATGPIFGSKMWWPDHDAEELERAALERAGLTLESLASFGRDGRGTRRPIRVFPEELRLSAGAETLTLEFSLDSGSYATTLLAEVTKDPDLRGPEVSRAGA